MKKLIPRLIKDQINVVRLKRRHKMIIEHMEFDFIASRLFHQKKLRFLDIGAHTGEFLTIFRKANHRHKYEVIAVEPLKKNLVRLHMRAVVFFLSGRGTVRVLPVGIGKDEKTVFFLGDSSTLFTSNSAWMQRFASEFSNVKEFEVQTKSFKVLQQQEPALLKSPFDLVKIDTEGSDLKVLTSLADSQIVINSVIIEFDKNSFSEMTAQLQSMGLTEIYAFVRNGIHTSYIGNIVNDRLLASKIETEEYLSGNLVAFRATSIAR